MTFHPHGFSDDLLATVKAVAEGKEVPEKAKKDKDVSDKEDAETVDDEGKKTKKEPIEVDPKLDEATLPRGKLVQKVMKPIKDKEKMFPKKEDEDLDEMKQSFALVDKGNKVVATSSSERDLKLNRPSLQNKFGELKLVSIKKKQEVGFPLKEDEDLDEASVIKNGRKFNNVKTFTSVKAANAWMEKNPGWGVLDDDGQTVFVANNKNKGMQIKEEVEDDSYGRSLSETIRRMNRQI